MNRIPRDLIRHLEWTPGVELPPSPTPSSVAPITGVPSDIAARVVGGQIFYNAKLPVALREAQAHAGTDGFVATMPLLLEARLAVANNHELWTNWYTVVTEENIGLSAAENPMYLIIHGGGILTPNRIEKAYTDKLLNGAAKYTSEEFRNALGGKLPDGTEIPVLSFDDFKTASDLPLRYGVAVDFSMVKGLPSGLRPIETLFDDPLVALRCGGVERARRYFPKANEVYKSTTQGNYHPFAGVDPASPQGRLLFLDGNIDGLGGSYDLLYNGGRFVGVGAAEPRPGS